MSDFEPEGYEDLREYVASSNGWNYLALVDDGGVIEAVIDIANDPRADWRDPSDNPVIVDADIAGGNSDIDTPVELEGTALYPDEPTVGANLSDTSPAHEDGFEEANVIVDGEDKVEISHEVELPEV